MSRRTAWAAICSEVLRGWGAEVSHGYPTLGSFETSKLYWDPETSLRPGEQDTAGGMAI